MAVMQTAYIYYCDIIKNTIEGDLTWIVLASGATVSIGIFIWTIFSAARRSAAFRDVP
jgi:Na+/melibiose symporter-like transporter